MAPVYLLIAIFLFYYFGSSYSVDQENKKWPIEKIKFRSKLGEILIDTDVISKQDLKYALEIQKIKNQKLGRILISLNKITASLLLRALTVQKEMRE